MQLTDRERRSACTSLGLEIPDAVALLLDHLAEGRRLLLQTGDLGGERLRVGAPGGVSRGGAGLGRARAGGAEVEAGRRVRGAAALLADGAGALLLAAGAVLEPLLQATDIKGQAVKQGPELAGHCWIQARLKRE